MPTATFPFKQKSSLSLSTSVHGTTLHYRHRLLLLLKLYNSSSASAAIMSFEDIESGRPLTTIGTSKRPSPQSMVAAVFEINTAVASFQRLVNSLGTPKDTLDLRLKLHNTRLRIGQLVKDTSAKLKQASETDHHSDVSPAKKISDAKLAKDFQSVLREFQKAQRLAADRETAYAPSVQKEPRPSRYTATELEMHSSNRPEQISLLIESTSQETVQLENEITFNEALIEEREQGIQEIQQQIGEVNEIFKDLAVLVHEQGSLIDDISSNVQNTHVSTIQAASQLTQASKYQKSSSSMTCLLLLIVGIVLLIVVFLVAA